MNTYLLTGNPEKRTGTEDATPGMSVSDYEESCRQAHEQGYADDYWTMQNQDSVEGDQVVLLRQGADKPGLIAFGQRRSGGSIPGAGSRQEQPVRFYNVRSLHDDPYISTEDLRKIDFWRSSNFPGSGTLLSEKELSALQTYCETVLRVPLSSLCSAPYALEPSVAERHDIGNEDNAGPTTGPAPSSWTATVEHSINALEVEI